MSNPHLPYSAFNEASGPNRRADILNEIIGFVQSNQSVSLVGPHGIGKTFMLEGLMQASPQMIGSLIVYLNCGVLFTQSHEAILWHFCSKIAEALDARGIALEPALKNALDRPGRVVFERAIRRLNQRGLRIVIILDDFEFLSANASLDVSFLQALRSAAGRYQLVFVTASTRPLIDLTYSNGADDILSSPFFNIFAPLFLGLLEEAEVRAFIHQKLGVSWTSACEDRLYNLVGAYPLALEIACQRALETPNAPLGIELRTRRALQAPFEDCWHGLDATEHYVLMHLPEAVQRESADTTVRVALRSLVQKCVLVYDGGVYRYVSRAWADFVAEQAKAQAGKLDSVLRARRKTASATPFAKGEASMNHFQKLIAAVVVLPVLACIVGSLVAWPRPDNSGIAESSDVPDPRTFRIVAESEVKSLEDAGILADFSRETGIELNITYQGPVDIEAAVAGLESNNPGTVDSYWPGISLWLSGSADVEPESVMKTYVVLAVDPETTRELGWDAAQGITAQDLVNAVREDQINLAMTSATQSTPGAAFYLAMYTALTGERVLTSDDLNNAETVEDLKVMLMGVDRSSNSLDRLVEIFLEDRVSGAHRYNAIVIYESFAIQMNQELIAQGQAPMTIFYVEGATAIADVPIRYVDNGSDLKLEQYQQLVEYLRRPEVQARIRELGWRTSPVGMAMADASPVVFNRAWGVDTASQFREMTFPKPPVTRAALDQYQTWFRKPSYTVYCLDYSGSMRNNGGRWQMIDAMDLLLGQDRAASVRLQATPEDVTVVYGFADDSVLIGDVIGNDPDRLSALSSQISGSPINGGTAMFSCVQSALGYVSQHYEPDRYAYSVIAMTDGMSNQGATASVFAAYYTNTSLNVPVYGIAFGDADFSQMEVFATLTGGAVFDGRTDIAAAFRQAKGNN